MKTGWYIYSKHSPHSFSSHIIQFLFQMCTGANVLSSVMWRGVLIACMLLHVAAKSDPEPRYLVLFPAQLQSLSSAKVCVHVFDFTKSFALSITLQTNVQNQTLFFETVGSSSSSPSTQEPSSYYKCTSFQVPLIPQTTDQDGVVAKLVVRAKDKGSTVIFEQGKFLYIIKPASGTFVQTDKPIYKRGEKVRCRIVSLDSKLIPLNDEYPLVELQDPQRNRIGQWLHLKPNQGIAEFSFQLISEAMLGDYTIHVKKLRGADIYQTFTVDEYVLPKFEVNINTPKVVNVLDADFNFSVCGRYTYGKPVKGTFQATVCRNMYYWSYWARDSNLDNGVCQEFSGKTDINGCYPVLVKTKAFMIDYRGYQMQYNIMARFEEDGTGVKLKGSGTVPISETLVTLEFQSVENYYRPDIPFTGKIVMKKSDGTPIPNRPVYLSSLYSELQLNKTYITDANGTASFSLITTNWIGYRYLRASYLAGASSYSPQYRDAYLYIQEFYSNTHSYVLLQHQDQELKCGTKANIRVDYVLLRKELKSVQSQSIFYLVITRGEIIINDRYDVPLGTQPKTDVKGSFFISLQVSPDLAPTARVLVYAVLPTGGAMANNFDFNVAKCFKNKASLQFSKSQVLPGSSLSLNIQAATNSLCAVRAVDKSVLLLKPEMELTADLVYSILPVLDLSGYPYQVEEYNSNPCNDGGNVGIFIRRPYYYYQSSLDTFNIFKSTGMKVITNCDMKKPINCSKLYPEDSMIMGAGNGEALRPMKEMDFVQPAPSNNVYKSKARTDFRETWLWQLQPVGDRGKSISVTIPDTITEWKASMFCTASIGFGLADTVSVITFKPFFVEPALPYSMIRGESIDLKVKVFNYLKDCIMVRVSLANSNDFVAVPCAQCQYTTCLCGNEDKTISWSVTPKSLGVVKFTVSAEAIQTNQRCGSKIPVVPKEGKIDTVIKSVLVEPEGVLVELSKSSLICASDTPVKEDAVLQPPDDAIAGSARAEVFVIGDIMGSAMQNLDKLLAMPNGCGEQNMLGLSVDISVLQYLKATNQLTDEIKANGITFLESGYQTELTYKHDDCSFSAFGNRDTTGGSLWLTAFVVSQLGKAADFTFIDSNVIQCAVQWISQHQLGNGCFKSTGNLYHTSMKGGVNDDVSLSAYVCYSLQELPNPTTEIDSLISSSLQCLRNELPNVTNPYTMALLANVFRNPEDATYRQALLDKLDQLATKQAGMIHWKTSQSSGPSSHPYWDPAPSAQVELAGYVMLAYLSKPSVSASDIGYVSAIARWMVKQQGPYGGFETTQDTVVGFAALAKYAALVSGGTLQATVKIFKGQLVLATLQVTNANRLLLQQRSLKDIPGNYTIEVTGKGCVFVQRILRYNIHPRNSQTTFTIQVKTDSPKCAPVSQFNIGIAVSYRGSRNATNMVLIEVKILSGFSPDADSLEQVLEKPLVKKVDYNNQLVTIYLDELLQQQTVEYAILVNQDFAVSNQQPAAVKVYDYYKPEENAVTEYNTPCKKGI